jgi:hypothetical protein
MLMRDPSQRIPETVIVAYLLRSLNRVSGAEHLILVEGYWSVFRLQTLGVGAIESQVLELKRQIVAAGARAPRRRWI